MDKKEKGSHAQGDNPVEKQASQLAYDVKYKVKAAMNKGTKMNPAQVAKAYLSQLAKSPAPPAVKAMAKKKLMGEEYTQDIKTLVQSAVVNAMVDVFTEEVEGKKFKIRVTDKKTGNTYIRNADRAKIAELRANPNISSVEITSHGEVSGDEKSKGKQTAAAKAGKDYDGDGKVESGAKEYRGAVHNAIQRKKGGKADGQDTSSVKEGVIYEKEGAAPEKKSKITGKSVDNYKDSVVKLFPKLGEQVENKEGEKKSSKIDPAEARANQAKKMVLMKKLQALRSGAGADIQASAEMKGSVVEEDCGSCSNCGGKGCAMCAKGENQKEGDERELRSKMDLIKNKMRSAGIKVAGETPVPRNRKMGGELGEAVDRAEYEKVAKEPAPKDDKKAAYAFKDNKRRQRDLKKLARLVKHADGQKRNPALYNSFEAEGEMTEGLKQARANVGADKCWDGYKAKGTKKKDGKEVPNCVKEEESDRLKDRRMERGGVGGNQRYDRPPAKKLSNAELGIKPGKTAVQKELEKKHGKGASAMDIVRAEIRAKHGKGAIK